MKIKINDFTKNILTLKQDDFFDWELDRENLMSYSKEELTEIILLCITAIREKNKMIKELKK